MRTDRITIRRWFDRHLHIRDGDKMKLVLPCTLRQRATGAVLMGNLPHPYETSSIKNALAYKKRIMALLPEDSDFNPRMTLYLTDHISVEEAVRGFEEDVWCAIKLYMADQNGEGGTTGSQHGVRNLIGRYKIFEAMIEAGKRRGRKYPLLGHWEAVEEDVDEFAREIVSVERDLVPLLKEYPELPVVFEHITDGRAADFVVESGYDIHATVTAHHLMLNRNALFRGGMNPENWCKPVLKSEPHRRRVRNYVTSGNRRFGAGTDSAPHDEEAKSRCCGCAAGIFTAPAAVELYTTIFDEDNALENLDNFLSGNFLHLYGMKASSEMMTVERTPFKVPKKVGTVQVFKGNTELQWKLVD